MDEVAGRGSSAPATQSDDQDKNNVCAQCAESGNVVSAAGFCRTCTDFLCTSCLDQHKILRGLKDHDLLEGDRMLNSGPAVSKIENCTVHYGRPIEAYCKDDDTFGCLECFLVGHRSCKNIGKLSDLSHDVESSKEFLDVHKATERCKTLEEKYRQVIQKYMSVNELWHRTTLEDFQKFRSNILGMVDEIGEKISKEADTLKEDNERQLRDLAQQVATYAEQARQYMLNIDEKKARNQKEQLFLVLKKTGRDILDSVHHMESIYQNIRIRTFSFSSDPAISASLHKNIKISVDLTPVQSKLGIKAEEKEGNTNIQTSSSPATTCISTSKINIKSHEDNCRCVISGIIELSPTQLILSDWSNRCLKLIDLTSSTVIKRRAYSSPPWDITILPKDRIAVSFPEMKQINIFTADENLDLCESIDVFGECRGLDFTGERLVISFIGTLPQVQILDLMGNVLQSIQHDATGQALLANPIYNTSSPDNKRIYVSDYGRDTVTCMDTTGAIQWVYQDQDLKSPTDVTSGDGGTIFVCGCTTIHVISSDGSKLAVIPQSQSGVKNSQAVFYSSYHRALYVSGRSIDSDSCNYISKLKLQQTKVIKCGSKILGTLLIRPVSI